MAKQSLPKVVIVGRKNVGKSTLFNRLSTKIKSITLEYEGVTRDFVRDQVTWQDKTFELIDTGGISFEKTDSIIDQKVQQIALQMLEQADVVLFVCDGTVGILPQDREIAKKLYKSAKKVILIINKADSARVQEFEHEFARFGFSHTLFISAQHGKGIAELLELVISLIPKKESVEQKESTCSLVILGKPNVGKSSLLNQLLQQERAIVADMPGTTREALQELISYYQEPIELIDTPGLRRKRGITEPIEKLMAQSALASIDRAEMVLLMIDGSEGIIADQELKLAFYVFEEKKKALLLLVNKQDIVEESQEKSLKNDMEQYTYFFKKIRQLSISCKTGRNIGKILPIANEICKRYHQRLSDEEITRIFKQELIRRPLFKSEHELIVYKARQIKTGPITIALNVNIPPYFGPSQIQYFDNILREHFDLTSVPVKFVIQK